jgi:hypothetical protein
MLGLAPLPSAAQKTWTNFQTDFFKAAQDLQESNSTWQASGYHGANAAIKDNMYFREETAAALANLANATALDRSTLPSVTATLAAANAIPDFIIKVCQHNFKSGSNVA